MEKITLELLKSILQGYVILHTWNDGKEDFDILCESTVVDFEKRHSERILAERNT